MTSRLKTVARKHDVRVMDLRVQAKFVSSITHMPTVLTTRVADCFIVLQQSKTWLSTVLMLAMHLVKPHHQNRVSSSVQTVHSETGGIKAVANPSQRALSSPCNVQCKVTLRHRVFGRNISTKSCANWD